MSGACENQKKRPKTKRKIEQQPSGETKDKLM